MLAQESLCNARPLVLFLSKLSFLKMRAPALNHLLIELKRCSPKETGS